MVFSNSAVKPPSEAAINVLIVEDNPGDRIFIIHLLRSVESPRFELLHAPSLADALERANDGIDVILLDLRLPDSEDMETLRRVHAAAPHIPVIVLTGIAGQKMGLEALSHGACDYLLKGKIDAHLLVQAILRHTRRGKKEGAA